jgi:DNA helicase IV
VAPPIDLAGERAALAEARDAVEAKLDRLSDITAVGADEYTEGFIDAVVAATMHQLQQELTVFGRIDDDHPWRIGLFGIDRGGEQLVVDWRARFAEGFYQATMTDPMGLERRVSYVGCIDDLMVEEFGTGEVSGTSPLMAELSRSRGPEMRTAVATLQAEQDRLVRLDPAARLVLRGGPGTGKTVVGLHRAAWLVYNDRRITSDRILVLGPSERFLRFVSTVLPTLGEARIVQTTFDRHLRGPTTEVGGDPRWLDVLDRLESSLLSPGPIRVRGRTMPEDDVATLVERVVARDLPWRERRNVFLSRLVHHFEAPRGEVDRAAREVFPPMSAAAAWRKLRSRATLQALGTDDDLVAAWRAVDGDGPLRDEVAARFDGVATRYSHVIVDEAQDLTLLQLRAVQRRADGVTLVGDDAQRSVPHGLGLREIAARLDAELAQMATAYRMSAEIADWLNAHAARHHLDAVQLLGVRPTGIEVTTADDATTAADALRDRWAHVAVIDHSDVWSHKGVEYDAVVVDAAGMTPSEVYLSASRAAHQLVVVGG